MKKLLCLIALAALCGCASKRTMAVGANSNNLNEFGGKGFDTNGVTEWAWGTETNPLNPNYEHSDYVPNP